LNSESRIKDPSQAKSIQGLELERNTLGGLTPNAAKEKLIKSEYRRNGPASPNRRYAHPERDARASAEVVDS